MCQIGVFYSAETKKRLQFTQKNGKYTRLDIQTLHMYTHKILPNLWKMYMSTAFSTVRQFRLFGRFYQLLGERGSQKGCVNPDRPSDCMANWALAAAAACPLCSCAGVPAAWLGVGHGDPRGSLSSEDILWFYGQQKCLIRFIGK